MKPPKRCPITGEEMRQVFTHLVLGKYEVAYYYCDHSGLLQTEEPHWLAEAYQSVISKLDTWVAARNVLNQHRLEPVLALLFPAGASFVDVGCGYGLLVRLMRDIGFNFRGHDEYCANLFSTPFPPVPGTPVAALCAFEVLEHLVNPKEFLAEQFRKYNADTLIASTGLFDGAIPSPEWPYYSFESGQHVTLYQPRSLDLLARSVGARYFPLGGDLHLITRRKIPALKLLLLRQRFLRKPYAAVTRFRRRHRSYITEDYEMIRREILSGESRPAPATPPSGPPPAR